MSKHIANLISKGENQQLDFKHSISDSKKIARSLVAFANTQGGTLLIGVKDNGNISGINSDEEYYMLEGAAQMYCKPEVRFKAAKWEINGKTVLEIYVHPDPKKLYKAPDKNGNYRVFFRVHDENVLATPLQIKVWHAIKSRKPISMEFSEREQLLTDLLKENHETTIEEYSRLAFISQGDAEEILVKFAALGIVELVVRGEQEVFLHLLK